MKPLTGQQKRFCSGYVLSGNATQAYIDAGYRARGSSAESSASRMLRNVRVLAEIARCEEALAKKLEMKEDEVLRLWSVRARGTLADVADVVGGRLLVKDWKELTSGQIACIKKVTERVTPSGEVLLSVELVEPKGYLDSIAKHRGMFDKQQQTGEPVMIVLNMGEPPPD